jgi:hypothetical protein
MVNINKTAGLAKFDRKYIVSLIRKRLNSRFTPYLSLKRS